MCVCACVCVCVCARACMCMHVRGRGGGVGGGDGDGGRTLSLSHENTHLHIRSSACKLYFSIAGIAQCNVFHDGVVSFPLLEAKMPPYVGFAPFISHHNKFVFFARRHFCERERQRERVLPLEWVPVYRYT